MNGMIRLAARIGFAPPSGIVYSTGAETECRTVESDEVARQQDVRIRRYAARPRAVKRVR